MASYKYEVVGADGKPKTGTIEAMNMEVASAELKSGGNTIVSIARANAFNKDLEIHIGKAVSVREMSVFCRQFESVLNAGVTVVEALDMLSEQTENKPFANAIAEVRDSVQRGETLAVAMAEHPKIFPNLMVQMVAAGESSGGLDKAFSRVGSQFEKEAHLKGLIIKSAIYPVILILVIIVVVAIMMIKIVPTFTAQFDEVGGKLPGHHACSHGSQRFLCAQLVFSCRHHRRDCSIYPCVEKDREWGTYIGKIYSKGTAGRPAQHQDGILAHDANTVHTDGLRCPAGGCTRACDRDDGECRG